MSQAPQHWARYRTRRHTRQRSPPKHAYLGNGWHAWARVRTTWHHRSKAPPRSLDDRFPGGWTISRAQAPLRQGSHRRASGLYAFCTCMQPGHLRHCLRQRCGLGRESSTAAELSCSFARYDPIPAHPSVGTDAAKGPTAAGPRPGERALRASTEIPASQRKGQGASATAAVHAPTR